MNFLRAAAAPRWSAMCEELAAVLRGWPVREIERDVRLSSAQRIAFYELVTASLKAADTLGSACPAETALTPVGRMDTMRERLCSRARGHRRDPPRAHALLRGARSGAEGEIRGDELGSGCPNCIHGIAHLESLLTQRAAKEFIRSHTR